jgi:hypothetical protein
MLNGNRLSLTVAVDILILWHVDLFVTRLSKGVIVDTLNLWHMYVLVGNSIFVVIVCIIIVILC